MNKELKLLLISLALILIGVSVLYLNQDTNCWDKHSTEQSAIQSCEGNQ
jgi:hypothetical protein